MNNIIILASLLSILSSCTPAQVHQDVSIAEEALQEGEQIYDQYNNPVVIKKVPKPAHNLRQLDLIKFRH